MTAIKYAAAAVLAAALVDAVPELADRVQVLDAPPTEPAQYPAAAIVLDGDFPFVPGDGEEIDDANGDQVMNGPDALVEMGSLRGNLRIFVAARTPVQREQLEERILRAFLADEMAITRLLCTVRNVAIADIQTGVDWPVAFFIESTTWSGELVFSEKRWAFVRVEVDLPVLAYLKNVPKVTTMLAAFTTDMVTAVGDPSQLANVTDLEQYAVDEDGSYTPHP